MTHVLNKPRMRLADLIAAADRERRDRIRDHVDRISDEIRQRGGDVSIAGPAIDTDGDEVVTLFATWAATAGEVSVEIEVGFGKVAVWLDGDEDADGCVMVREYKAAGFDVDVLPGLVLAPTAPTIQT